MKKSLWFFIGLGTNLVVSSSIIASCGHNVKTPADDPLNYDQKFGFNKATYDKLEDDFKSALSNKIVNADRFPQPEKWAEKIKELGGKDKIESDLQKSLDNFRTNFFTETGALYSSSFNTKTETLINFAKQNYEINLNRTVDKQVLENEIDEIKKSYLDYLTQSWDIVHKDDPDKATIIQDKIDEFNKNFNKFLDEVKQDCNDEATILNKLRIKLVDYVSGANDELVRLSTQNQLRETLNAYRFEVDRDKLGNSNLFWEELESNDQYNPKDGIKNISTSFDKAFNIFDINDTNIFADRDTEPKKYNGLSDISISGYTLTPYIANLEADALKNEYYVDLDWQLVNENVYKEKLEKYTKLHNGDEEAAKNDEKFIAEVDYITAHSYTAPKNIADDDQESTLQNSLKEENLTAGYSNSYLWPASDKYAQKMLFKTFVNDGYSAKNKITFSWLDDINVNGYDTFYSNLDDNDDAYVDSSSLSKCGLQINGRTITDVVKEMETDSDEEIKNEPAKLCLRYCDLSAIYHFTNPLSSAKERNVEVKLNLSYAGNSNISCNPVAFSLDKQEQRTTIPVNSTIVQRTSSKAYDEFMTNYKIAEEKTNLTALTNDIQTSIDAVDMIVGILIGMGVIILALIATMIIKVMLLLKSNGEGWNSVHQKYHDTIAKYTTSIIILAGISILATIAVVCFAKTYLDELNTYRDNIENFQISTKGKESTITFVNKVTNYKQYTSKGNFDKLQDTDWVECLNVLGYFNNIGNNDDFKKYKQAREDANAWDPNTFWDLITTNFWWCIVGLIVVTVTIVATLIIVVRAINADIKKTNEFANLNQYIQQEIPAGGLGVQVQKMAAEQNGNNPTLNLMKWKLVPEVKLDGK